MNSKIDSAGNLCPRTSDEPLTPEQAVSCNVARDLTRTAEDRQKAMQPSANSIETSRWDQKQLQKGNSEIGERARAAADAVTSHMVEGSKAELAVTGKVGHGVELTGKVAVEITKEHDRWLVTETVGAGAEVGEHIGSLGGIGAGISGEWKRSYAYDFREGAVIGSATIAQKRLPDEVVDHGMNMQEEKLARRLVGESFGISGELFAGCGASAGVLGAAAEAKLGNMGRVAVNYETGTVTVEQAVEGSARVSVGAGAGGIGASTDVMGTHVAEKLETTYQLTASEAEKFKRTHDMEIIKAEVARGAASEKLIQDIKVNVGDKAFASKREVELDEHTPFAAARNLDGVELSWSEAASNHSERANLDLGFGSVKVETKVEHPGAVVLKSSLEDLAHEATTMKSSDAELTLRRVFANILR